MRTLLEENIFMCITNYQFKPISPKKRDTGKSETKYTILILGMVGVSKLFSPLAKFLILIPFSILQGN